MISLQWDSMTKHKLKQFTNQVKSNPNITRENP